MASMNGNSGFLWFAGTNISGYWTEEITYEGSVDTEDVTAGSGATHIQRLPKLKDRKMDFMVIYDDTDLATYVSDLDAGTQDTLIWGPQGNTGGMPCFTGNMILTNVKLAQSVQKTKLAFNLSFVQGDTPTKTIEGGDTF